MILAGKLPSQAKIKNIAVLTSGGDAPGMNAAVRAVVRCTIARGGKAFGVIKGYAGLLEGDFLPMELSSVANIIQRGGTILKTARCPEFHQKKARKQAAERLRSQGIEGLVVVGGDGSFAGASLLELETGFPTLGIPGTIDNDIEASEDTIGFDTAVNTAVEAIDRIRDTASSHDRVFLVEVMGRNSGFIALNTGIAGGAETVVVPESNWTSKQICQTIHRGMARGKSSSIVVVAEGPKPGLADRIGSDLHKLNVDAKICRLGHIQRGGSPSAHDRVLASVLASSATAHLMAGKSNGMIGVQKNRAVYVPFSQIAGKKKSGDSMALKLAELLAT